MSRLIDIEDVSAVLGRVIADDEAPVIQHIIDSLTALFCKEAGQDFTVKHYSQWLKVNGGQVHIRRYPLIEVTAVANENGQKIKFERRNNTLIVGLTSEAMVKVDYTAGYETVPEEIKLQLTDSVKRVLNISDTAAKGITQSTVTAGSFSESNSYASWAVGGQAILSPADIALARSYRSRKIGNTWVMR